MLLMHRHSYAECGTLRHMCESICVIYYTIYYILCGGARNALIMTEIGNILCLANRARMFIIRSTYCNYAVAKLRCVKPMRQRRVNISVAPAKLSIHTYTSPALDSPIAHVRCRRTQNVRSVMRRARRRPSEHKRVEGKSLIN